MENNQLLENAYIYGIYIGEELVYIGKTYQPLQDRIDAHVQRCHNKELQEALLNNHYTFKILYESHNLITSDILNSLEEALITTNKPQYNKCGVTMPYIHTSPQAVFEGGGVATILSQKHYYTYIDVQQLLSQNAQIKCSFLLTKDEYGSFFFDAAFSELSPKQQEQCIEYALGKTNKFNEMTTYGLKGFRQQTFCVRESDGSLRYPTTEEKLKGIKKSQLQRCHIVFLFKQEKDYQQSNQEFVKMLASEEEQWAEDQELDRKLTIYMEQARLSEAYQNYTKHIFKYYPLKIITLQGEDLKNSYCYIDTWQEEMDKE